LFGGGEGDKGTRREEDKEKIKLLILYSPFLISFLFVFKNSVL